MRAPFSAATSRRRAAMHRRIYSLALTAAVCLTGGASALTAQDGPAALVVTVRSAITGQPLRGAVVRVDGRPFRWETAANGVATLKGLPVGTRSIAIGALGHATHTSDVLLEAEQTSYLAVELASAPIVLDPLRVEAERSGYLEGQGFYARQRSGLGAFITKQELSRHRHRRLSDALRRIPGVTLVQGHFGSARPVLRGADRCSILYYLDNVPVYGFNIDDVPREDIEGIEVYRGASQIPARFNRRTAGCGVIVIWTRPGARDGS